MKHCYQAFALCWLFFLPACASTGTQEPVVEKTSQYYQFERLVLPSAAQHHRHQVTIALPNAPMPKNGYPVLYMLDGQKALAALTEHHFSRLQGGDWPVLVMLSYTADANLARAYDYTPPVVDSTLNAEGRNYGGADIFGQFIEQAVKPEVAKRVRLDTNRQSLWGHSFGGLFVLHSLFNHPERFQSYIAADPSLWWQEGQILNAEHAYRQRPERPLGQLLILRSASQRAGSVLDDDATRRLAERLSKLPELSVQYYDYFEHHHGSVRPASIPAALRTAQGEGKR
ncbi:MAG: alpha/beta hydrolase [Oceanisphaera sp.]